MEKALLSFCVSLFISSLSFGQIIQLSADTVHSQHLDVNLDNGFVDLPVVFSVTNLTSDTLNLKWERETSDDCPDSWLNLICDKNICYTPNISSNIEFNIYPFTLFPNETFDYFSIHYLVEEEAGCCPVKLNFSPLDDPDNIIATFTSFMRVNTDEDCDEFVLTSTTTVQTYPDIRIFPNPSTDFVYFSNLPKQATVEIINSQGQVVLKKAPAQNETNLQYLNKGIYWVIIRNDQEQVVKTSKLLKQ